jgi:hypothetical protein
MATVDLSTFFVTIEETTPIFKTRVESRTDISIYQTPRVEDVLEADAHRDPAYQASFNRCTSLGCTDYTKGFNYIPSCGECEQPLFTPFTDKKLTCLADILLQRINYDMDYLLSEERSENYGGGMPVIDNDIATGKTDYYYSDSYVEYKKYNVDLNVNDAVLDGGWKGFPGQNGEVSYNKFFAMSGYWLGFEPCHGANRLYQCAVSCENGEIVGCWQVGDLQRETGDNPLLVYGEVSFGSVWAFTGFEAGTPKRKFYQIYDPAQIIAAGINLTKEQIVPLNPTLSINNFSPEQQTEQTGYANCKTIRTSVDFGDADFLRETNCLSSSGKRSSTTETRCETCNENSYKPNRAIDKFLKFADTSRNITRSTTFYDNLKATELKDIDKTELSKLKFSIVGDVIGKIFTDGIDCYFPKTYTDETPGKFILGGPTTATKDKGFKQATYTDLGLSSTFNYGDCIQCLEAKANAEFETVTSAINEFALVSPFWNKCGVDAIGQTTKLKYNIDCNCVRCGDVYITGAPRYDSLNSKWVYEPWVTASEAERFINAPEKIKVTAVVNGQPTLIDDPECVPSVEQDPLKNPYYPFAQRKDPNCWDHNSGAFRRIWFLWDKSKTFTDFQFRDLENNIVSGSAEKNTLFSRETLWSGCGGLRNNDRAVSPFSITCYEKLVQKQNSNNERIIPSTLSIVTGVKYAAENEYTTAEKQSGVLPSDPTGLGGGYPRTYLYYSRRASTSYLPCDNTNFGGFLGTYRCSCAWLPCMDEVMLAAVPIKYGSQTETTNLKPCSTLSPINQAFPSVFEIHLEKSNTMTGVENLYPLVGPNLYQSTGQPVNTYRVGLNWDSNLNTTINFSTKGGAEAYKYQTYYFNNYNVDYLEPTYFWNKPITFMNTPGIIKSHNTNINNTYFRLQRLHDAYHINCSIDSNGNYGEFGYVPNSTPPEMGAGFNSDKFTLNNLFVSFNHAITDGKLPILGGPVVPTKVVGNEQDRSNPLWK